MAAAKINSPTSSPSPAKLSRRFTTVISYDLRDSEFRPVEKNRVELGPSNKPYETCEVQKDLARKFGVTPDSVRVGRFRRALNRENLMYAVVCGCRHGHTTRHVFVHDYQKASTDYPVCICVDANISVRGLLCCLDSQHDQYCLFMNGRMLDLEIHQVSDWQPVTFLQMIRRQNVKILLSWHGEPGVKIVFYLSVQNTDTVDEIRRKLLGQHAKSLKCEGKEISFSEGSTILSNRCVPKILALTSDGEVLSEVCKMPLSVHVHTAESVPVHVRFCDDAFIIFVPRGTSFRSLKSEIAKVLDEPPWSLEYSANSECLEPDDLVGHPSENGQSCTVELVRGVVADVKIHIDFANVTGLDFVHVQIYRQESLDALRISLAKKLSVHPNCVWFHDMENAIPPADSPVAEFLQPAGEVMQLTLTAREHPRCTVLQVCCKKFRTVDSLWVDNSEQRTCGQLLQYLQQSMGTRTQRRVVAFCGAQRIAENCTLSLAAADLNRLPRLTVHLSSKCLPPWELPPPYQQRFVGCFSGGFEREYFLNINGIPHFTKRVPTPSSQPQTEEIISGFTLLTTHFLDKVSAQLLTVATSKVDATVGFEPCNPGDPSGNMSVAAGRKFCRGISQTEGRNVGIIRPSVPHQNWHRAQPLPNSQDIVYPTPTHARQQFTNGGQHRQVAPVRPSLRSYPDGKRNI